MRVSLLSVLCGLVLASPAFAATEASAPEVGPKIFVSPIGQEAAVDTLADRVRTACVDGARQAGELDNVQKLNECINALSGGTTMVYHVGELTCIRMHVTVGERQRSRPAAQPSRQPTSLTTDVADRELGFSVCVSP